MTLSEHELEQRRREAALPLWTRLQMVEDLGRLAQHLSTAPTVPPPLWAQEWIRDQQQKRQLSEPGSPADGNAPAADRTPG